MTTLSSYTASTQPPLVATVPPLPSAPALLGHAFSFYREHWVVIAGISAIPFLVSLCASVFTYFFHESAAVAAIPFFGILTILATLFARLALFEAVIENGEPQGGVAGAYGKGVHLFFPFMWVTTLSTLATLGGFFLLVIPGFLLSTWLSLSFYVLFAEDRRGVGALARSWQYVKGYWGAVFWRFLFAGIIFSVMGVIISLFIAGPGIIVFMQSGKASGSELFSLVANFFSLAFNHFFLVPLGIIYAYGIYGALRYLKNTISPEGEEQKFKRVLTVFSIIGIAGIIALIFLGGVLLVKFLPQLWREGVVPELTSLQFLSSAFVSSPLFGMWGIR